MLNKSARDLSWARGAAVNEIECSSSGAAPGRCGRRGAVRGDRGRRDHKPHGFEPRMRVTG
eukprot:991176-Pyramimonas_sp.AAC.1